MKSQVAAEVAAAASLARSGWRPARGELLIVCGRRRGDRRRARRPVADRDPPREGALRPAAQRGRRRRVRVRRRAAATASAAPRRASSASRSRPTASPGTRRCRGMGDNALLKMAPLLERLAARQPSYSPTEEPRAFLRGLGEDPDDPQGAIARLRAADPRLATMFEPMLGVTFTPTRIQRLGEDQRDPRSRRAEGRLPRAAGPRRGGGARGHRRRCSATGRTAGRSSSPSRSSATARRSARELMDAIAALDRRARPRRAAPCR